jgi:hypothetical protein
VYCENSVTHCCFLLYLSSLRLIENYGRFLPTIDLHSVTFDETVGQELALGCVVFRKEVIHELS